MAILDELVSQIDNPDLRARIAAEVEKLAKQKKFGLVFEEHLPECTPLYEIPVKAGATVALKAGQVNDVYAVLKIENGVASCLRKADKKQHEIAVEDLVTVAEFGDPIYPQLIPMDTVENAPDSDLWHTLIQADNYHALQLLEYLYAGKVDCIYIDPPYNTGARDWKYNNDYVDNSDQYRHSKWLSMMQKRLKIAKKLLNPSDSVLIVTIDDKEYLHLGCLLEEMFPEAHIQMISSIINPYGAIRFNEFTRTNEYIYYVMIGNYSIGALDDTEYAVEGDSVAWFTYRRSNARHTRPRQFYPIYVNNTTHKIQEIGDPISSEVDRFSVPAIEGCTAVFPVMDNGAEMMWGLTPDICRKRLNDGYIKVGKHTPNAPQQYIIQYLRSGTIDDINDGKIRIVGHNPDGSVIAENAETKKMLPRTQWSFKTHNARDYGSKIVKSLLGSGRFDFPKSLYAVRDTIRYLLWNKPDAIVIDFFAGSGTTLHAVNLLNAEDGGHRRCIMVTNNEVSEAEAKALTAKGHKPGDPEWERLGIAQYVTWPRTVCSIEGHDVNGKPLKGNYVDSEIPMAQGFKANAAFFKLGFLDKNAVALGRQFKQMLPTLWMKAGAVGKCPTIGEETPDMLILPENKFAVLVDEKQYMEFADQMDQHPEIETVFIVTDSEAGYRDMIAGLNVKQSFQLYRDYLDNFRINAVRR